MLTILWGILRVIGLQGFSLLAGAWLNPLGKILLGGIGVAGAVLLLHAAWPGTKSAVEWAVIQALGESEQITQANTDEQQHDTAWLDAQEKWLAAEREAAAKAAGAAGDRVVWRSDDPWLRAKRTAASR